MNKYILQYHNSVEPTLCGVVQSIGVLITAMAINLKDTIKILLCLVVGWVSCVVDTTLST